MRRCVAVLAQQGINVIVDDLLFKSDYLDDYRLALAGLEVWFVGVPCPLAVVEQREAQRPGRFPGTATSHFHEVHAHGQVYDIEVNTGKQDPVSCAKDIVARLQQPPLAFLPPAVH